MLSSLNCELLTTLAQSHLYVALPCSLGIRLFRASWSQFGGGFGVFNGVDGENAYRALYGLVTEYTLKSHVTNCYIMYVKFLNEAVWEFPVTLGKDTPTTWSPNL